MSRKNLIIIIVGVLALGLATTTAALGAGFEVAETSGRQLGNGYAGKAAGAEDASTVFYNPAGMTRLPSWNVVASLELLFPNGTFGDQGSTHLLLGTPLTGGNGGSPGSMVAIPNSYITYAATEQLSFGLGLNSQYGLKTHYSDGWAGRYQALKSDLATMNINPSMAYQVNEQFSIGGGVNYSRARAEISNAVDFGGAAMGLNPTAAIGLGLGPQNADGVATVDSDWVDAWGWNLGVLYQFTERTRLGLAFRSKISHVLEGDATFTMPANADAFFGSAGLFRNGKATARITLPEQVYFSGYHEFNDQWAVLADVTWTRWSRFEELRVDFDNPNQPDSTHKEDWDDVFRYSLGAIYRPNGDWALRCGVVFDESPIKDANRSPRIPTNDRWWIAVGVGYRPNKVVSIDLSYAHIFIKEGKIDQTVATGQRLKGEFDGSADIIGLQLTFTF